MNKFLGMLFFYVSAFFNKERAYNTEWGTRGTYIQEKSKRYLNVNISYAEWELLKIYLKDLPEPVNGKPLSTDDIYTLIESFDKVFGIKNIDYELRMYGIEYDEEMKIIDLCFENLTQYISIIGSSNGISIIIGGWLEDTEFDKVMINREINLIELT